MGSSSMPGGSTPVSSANMMSGQFAVKSLFCLRILFFFLRFYLFIFREMGKEGEEGEKHQCVVASRTPPTGDLARNPGMCPDWESTSNPLVHRPALNPLSHTSQGNKLKKKFKK